MVWAKKNRCMNESHSGIFAPDYSGARPNPIKDVLCLLGTAKLLPGSAQSSQQELLQRLA